MKFRLFAQTLCLAAGVAALASGCSSDGPNRVRMTAMPMPMGTHTIGAMEYQVRKAEVENYILYRRYWVRDQAQLPPHGREKLEWIADKLFTESYPVIVEPSGNADLDEARRQAVTRYLAAQLGTDAGLTVVVMNPPSNGTEGDEAVDLYEAAAGSGL